IQRKTVDTFNLSDCWNWGGIIAAVIHFVELAVDAVNQGQFSRSQQNGEFGPLTVHLHHSDAVFPIMRELLENVIESDDIHLVSLGPINRPAAAIADRRRPRVIQDVSSSVGSPNRLVMDMD